MQDYHILQLCASFPWQEDDEMMGLGLLITWRKKAAPNEQITRNFLFCSSASTSVHKASRDSAFGHHNQSACMLQLLEVQVVREWKNIQRDTPQMRDSLRS